MIYSNIFRNIVLILISTVFLSGCSKVKTQNNSLDISIKHSNIYAWLNLMPGGPSSFHITGNLTITNEEAIKAEELELRKIIITQEDKTLYRIEPLFEPVDDIEIRNDSETEKEKQFRFMVKSGLEISPDLDPEKTIDAKLIFNAGDKIFEYMITDISVEKAY